MRIGPRQLANRWLAAALGVLVLAFLFSVGLHFQGAVNGWHVPSAASVRWAGHQKMEPDQAVSSPELIVVSVFILCFLRNPRPLGRVRPDVPVPTRAEMLELSRFLRPPPRTR